MPESSTFLLLGGGLVALGWFEHRSLMGLQPTALKIVTSGNGQVTKSFARAVT